MKVLISPAKSIDTKRPISTPTPTVGQFLTDAEFLVNVLKKLTSEDLQKLMHVSADIAELNVTRNHNWIQPIAPSKEICPAIVAFTGEVYRGLDVATFTTENFLQAQKTIRILSGLYGLLRPLDLIYPYRLEMGTKLLIDANIKSLYKYWGTRSSQSLQGELLKGEIVVKLASTEYSKALPFKELNNPVITPVFKDFKNSKLKVVSVYAKHARGEMARWIALKDIQTANELKLWNGMGYQYDDNLSSETEYVFTR